MANGWMVGKPAVNAMQGYDWAIVQLGVAGRIQAFDIDTTFFTGNYPASASVEACYAPDGDLSQAEWVSILDNYCIRPESASYFQISSHSKSLRHVRLNIFPDGGVARFKVYGTVEVQTAR